MKNFLGIDYGRKKIGVALATSPLAEPFGVYETAGAFNKIGGLIKQYEISAFVVGESEGDMAIEARSFGEKLAHEFSLPVYFVDETLTTQDVQRKSIESGMSRKKRKKREDAFAAALILQSYLDSQW
jgi:putative Holliday junction resolvase